MRDEERDNLGVAIVSSEHQLRAQTTSYQRSDQGLGVKLLELSVLTRVSPFSFVRLAGKPAASGVRKLSTSPLRAKSKN